MPSAIGHAIFALSLTPFRPKKAPLLPFMLIAVACAILPDLDVAGFEFGIRYSSPWGHRGFSHSILFAILTGVFVSYLFFKEIRKKPYPLFNYSLYFFMCTLSHGIFDAMTDGGLGVGFFIPFLDDRYFFPYRPIAVSPLNLEVFFTNYGWSILLSEIKFIGWISMLVALSGYYWRTYQINIE